MGNDSFFLMLLLLLWLWLDPSIHRALWRSWVVVEKGGGGSGEAGVREEDEVAVCYHGCGQVPDAREGLGMKVAEHGV
jgi:hypothetical protein